MLPCCTPWLISSTEMTLLIYLFTGVLSPHLDYKTLEARDSSVLGIAVSSAQ